MTDNHRQETRLYQTETIFIEVRNSYPADEKTDRLLICNSLDLSANGIRALIDQPLPVDAIYQLCVEIHDSHERLFLAAQVKWVRAAPNGGYFVGLLIFESDDTDIERWKRHIANRLSQPDDGRNDSSGAD